MARKNLFAELAAEINIPKAVKTVGPAVTRKAIEEDIEESGGRAVLSSILNRITALAEDEQRAQAIQKDRRIRARRRGRASTILTGPQGVIDRINPLGFSGSFNAPNLQGNRGQTALLG